MSQSSQSSKKITGRPPSDIWDSYFKKGKEISKGHYEGSCNYCSFFQNKGSPQDFEDHLANNCPNVPSDIQQKYLNKILQRFGNLIKKTIQTKIIDFYES